MCAHKSRLQLSRVGAVIRRIAGPGSYLVLLAMMPAEPALARDAALFDTTNGNPFIAIYSLPSPAETPPTWLGATSLQLSFDLSNSSRLEQDSAGERLALDGETYRGTALLYHRFSPRWSLGAALPVLRHSGGFMDGFITNWHELFGLSNERRDVFDDGRLDFSYAGQNDESFMLRQDGWGIGDVRLLAEWQAWSPAEQRRSLVLRGGVKLPTASNNALRGSGSTDLSLQLMSTDEETLSGWGLTLGWMVGGLWLGDADVLDGMRRDAVAIGAVGVSRPVWRKLSARLQLDGHTAFYDSDLDALGSGSIQLTVGGSIALQRGGRLDFAMKQNLFTDATPDFGIHLGWRNAR